MKGEKLKEGLFPAIGMVEFNSVAVGIYTCDSMIKKAPVTALSATPVCPGKYVVLLRGDEASVAESIELGKELGGEKLVDSLIIPNVHPGVIPAILGTVPIKALESVGVMETFSVASAILAADAAVKAAEIELIEIMLARGLGGKSFVTLTGELHQVEAAIDAGVGIISGEGMLVSRVIIQSPHPDMEQFIL